MTDATQIISSETFAFIAVLVFKTFNREVLFINRRGNINC